MIGAEWWVDVWTQVYFEMSHIFTVLSIDPEANTAKLEWFKDTVVTESVWLPALYFLALLVNFLGFLVFYYNSPPKMISGWIA